MMTMVLMTKTNMNTEHNEMLTLTDPSLGDVQLPEEGVNLDLSQVISVDTLTSSSHNTSFRTDRSVSPFSLPAPSTVGAGYSLLLPPGPRTHVVRQPLGPGSGPGKGFDRRKGVTEELDLRKEKTELIPHQASKLASSGSITSSKSEPGQTPEVQVSQNTHPSEKPVHRDKSEPDQTPEVQVSQITQPSKEPGNGDKSEPFQVPEVQVSQNTHPSEKPVHRDKSEGTAEYKTISKGKKVAKARADESLVKAPIPTSVIQSAPSIPEPEEPALEEF